MTTLLLDRRGDAPPPGDSVVIERECDLLDAILHSLESSSGAGGDRFLVRGAELCAWAEKVWRGRDWPLLEWHSPIDALLECAPNLSRADGALLWTDLGTARECLSQPYATTELLQVLYPEFAWHSHPSVSHAAEWLLWLDAAEVPTHCMALLEAQARLWHTSAEDAAPLYAMSRAGARQILRSWLHLENGQTTWGVFPLPPPSRWIQEARRYYEARLTREGANIWEQWRQMPLPLSILEVTASVTGDFLTHHHAQATPSLVNALLPFVPPAEAVRLRALCPPPDPGAPPQRTSEVLEWVTRKYLGFRLWQAETSDAIARERVNELARSFGLWYLEWYSGAVVGISARHLATQCAEELRLSDESALVFWVIADGLGWSDAQSVVRHLTNRNPRLTVTREEPVFATVPTITRFCKSALRWSTTPKAVRSGAHSSPGRRETDVSGHRDAATLLASAQPGDIVIWTPLEPDKTYHEIADRSVAHTNVDGALRALGENILAAVADVPQNRALKIVLSTDHGRLSGGARRQHRVPPGFESHGRAAYRNDDNELCTSRPYNTSGIFVEDALAWLDPDRFGLPVECVVPLDDGAFLTNNPNGRGRGGIEEFPHGGVFPEEVVVPWIEIERDALTLVITAQAFGRSRPGTRGVLQVTVENTNALLLHVETLTLKFGSAEQVWTRDDALAPYSSVNFEIDMSSWPSGVALQTATAVLSLRRPDGRQILVVPDLALEAEELQSRDEDILSDLI